MPEPTTRARKARPRTSAPPATKGPTRERWLAAAVTALALAVRLYRLDAMPMGGDESGYLRWAEIIVHQKQWFISLLDGKQPLTCWLHALALALWPEEPLLAARWVSAAAGAGAALGIFAIGRRLGGTLAGLVGGMLYAFLPYALLYDRLVYTEAYVNLAGVIIVYASLVCFENKAPSWKPGLWVGLALGLGFFCKSTVVLFAFFPVLAAWWLRGPRAVPRLLAAYGVAAVFPVLSWAVVPRAPMMQTHSVLVHQTSFFVAPGELLRHPLTVAPGNLLLLGQYLQAYLTLPVVLAAVAALLYLVWLRSAAAVVLVSVSVLPWLFQVFTLQKMFPTRYLFPHVWPWLVIIGMAIARLPHPRARWLAAVVAIPLVVRGLCVVQTPQDCLYPEDAKWFLGSGPAAGYGLREAADFLLNEARSGPLIVFTDAIWGPPADSMFIYLNHRSGIRVYEAWWTTISSEHRILPPVPVEIMKSQYERISAGMLDTRQLDRVYYVTEVQYNPPAAVLRREPQARRIFSFPKPNGRNSIDVYRLR